MNFSLYKQMMKVNVKGVMNYAIGLVAFIVSILAFRKRDLPL